MCLLYGFLVAFCHSFVLLDLFSIVSLSKDIFHSLCRHYVVRGPENTPYTGKTISNEACKLKGSSYLYKLMN